MQHLIDTIRKAIKDTTLEEDKKQMKLRFQVSYNIRLILQAVWVLAAFLLPCFQAVAAGLCFVVMLVNYFIADLASYASTSAFGSLAALMIVALIACGVIYLMTKNGFATLMAAAGLEGGIMVLYIFNSDAFAGLFPEIMENLSLFERFYSIINGVFDLTNIVYFISVIGVFLFLSVQSMEKRRWNG